MHNINYIRENSQEFDAAMQKRGGEKIAEKILFLDKEVREKKGLLQSYAEQVNLLSRQIGIVKSKGKDATELLMGAEEIKKKISSLEGSTVEKDELHKILSSLPNILADDVPFGKTENDNQEIRKWGVPKEFSFPIKDHTELGENLQMMDFKKAAQISGSRFVILKKDLAKLERALANFMLFIQEENGNEEISPPLLVNSAAMFGTTQLPKFAEDAFQTTDNKWLISTSEISLTNMVREEILEKEELPKRFCAFTPCFRSEAGAAGRDTRGMIRLHQFNKVEMVSITESEKSEEEHQRMLKIAEDILQKLELPFRTSLLCSGDTGFGAKKTYDLEVWLPSEKNYREISSISNCGDFQARRMNARYKDDDKKNHFLHTLNGSGLAVGRTLVAILENYQRADGAITIPKALVPFMNGQEIIS